MPIQIHYEKQSTHCSGHQFCRSSTELSLVSNLKIGCQNISADVDFLRLKFNRSFFIKVPLLLRENFHCSFVFLVHIDYSYHLERGMVFFFVLVDNGFAYYRMWTFWAFSVFQSSSVVRTIFFGVSSVQTGGDDFPPPHTPNMYFLMENLRVRLSPPQAHLRRPYILLRKNGLLPCQAQFRHY